MGFVRGSIASLVLAIIAAMPSPSMSQASPLLLFDGETGREFAGCLNCNKYDDASVCNKYGKFGSKYEETSIWNKYGKFGSKYESNSPWNRYGPGLRVVDQNGNYYGKFTLSRYERSQLKIVGSLVEVYEKIDDLEKLRDLLCE